MLLRAPFRSSIIEKDFIVNLNATLVGQLIFILMIVMTILGYYLGEKKTNNPVLTAIIGFFSAFIPPLALILLMILVLKSDIDKTKSPA